MDHYDKKQVAKKLNVTEALVTKYALLFVKHNYEFIMDGLNSERIFTDKDIENFKQVIALKKVMKVEEAVKQIIKGNEVSLYNSVTPESLDNKLDKILDQLSVTNETMIKLQEENKVIKEELENIKSVTSNRDQVLLDTMRSILETKTQIAITQQVPKKWYQFWKK